MFLFQKRFHAGLVSGEVTLTFRRWDKPHVRPGGRYRCHPIGVLQVDRIDRIRGADITAADARRAGFDSLPALMAYLGEHAAGPIAPDTAVFRVELHHGGDGDRVEIALEDRLTPDDVATIQNKLARMDGRRPFTRDTLAIIRRRPRIAASKLAARLGRETLPFKTDVRKLKRLGLTQSFEVGYEISPRGRAYLAAVKSARAGRAAPSPSPPAKRRKTAARVRGERSGSDVRAAARASGAARATSTSKPPEKRKAASRRASPRGGRR